MKKAAKSLLLLVLLFALPIHISAQEAIQGSQNTLGFRLSHRSLPTSAAAGKIRPAVVSLDSTDSAFMFPVAANTPGSYGTYFRSDVQIANYGSFPEPISVYWFAAGKNNCSAGPVMEMTLNANTVYSFDDFVGGHLGLSGIGSVMVFGGAPGTPDVSAILDGSSRLWTPSGSGTTSMSFAAMPLTDLIGSQRGTALGLRQDVGFRTNVGVVNLDAVNAHTWTINIVGTRASNTFTVSIPPCSMNQVPLPAGNYGDVFLQFHSDGSGFWWSAYGVSADNSTGDGWVSHAAWE